MKINRREISDILCELPESEVLENGQYPQSQLFVATLGFEDRAHNLVTRFSEAGSLKEGKVLLIEYPTNQQDNEKNLHYFQNAANKSKGLERIVYSRNEYFFELTKALERLCKGESNSKVIFDVSTSSSYVFYPTMQALMNLDVDLTLVYSEAEVYFPSEADWKEVASRASEERTLYVEAFETAEFQSIGVEDVYASSLFSEMNPGNRPTIFVAVPNFNAARMNTLVTKDQEINKTPVKEIFWLIGEPPLNGNSWRVEAVRTTNNLANVEDAKVRFVSTLHYKDMIKILEEIWIEHRHTHHMSIGTLGSKMQHLGTYFFLMLHKDTGLLLAEPKSFTGTKYSSGCGVAWYTRLGKTQILKDSLSQYMTFRWDYS